MPSSEILDEVRFVWVQPSEGDPTFSLQEPALALEELAFEDMAALLSARGYLQKHGVSCEDLVRRFNVKPESLEALAGAQVPLYTWWDYMSLKARENYDEEQNVDEALDWWRIINTVLGFHTLHKHKEGYNLPLPKMMAFYHGLALLQQRGGTVEAVHPDQLDEFVAWMDAYYEALESRTNAYMGIEADVLLAEPPITLCGSVAAHAQDIWEAAV